MRIQVSRTGGFAGIARHGEIDTAGRPDAGEWETLAAAALDAGADGPPAGVPDGFRYRITIDGRTVHCADPRLTAPQRALITRVLKEGA
ncbi:protealysin inhibitor emfourin [Streptomyces sp. NRRL WC-3549]|uniref:protealysin inhibitor emfourin n=1 Tax=Streptomyces sp. NRRL WC-3549 TaxID=1463925 RepID=UPI0004C60543|nr:protealysin inhibitor emfourin [Streptomyces sp. NRRL WC-3549]